MPENNTSTKILQNVKIKPSWTGTYTMTNTNADYLVSGENLVLGFQKINAWLGKFDTAIGNIESAVTPVSKGGTGLNTIAANSLLVATTADLAQDKLTAIAPSGSGNEFLISTTGTNGNVTPHFANAADTRSALGIDDAIVAKLKDVHAMTIKGVVTPTTNQTDEAAIASYVTTNSITPSVGDSYLVDHTADNEDFVEYVYVSDGGSPATYSWEYIGKHEVGASDATYNNKGVVLLSDSTSGTQTAGDGSTSSDATAATPLAVSTAKTEAINAAKDARSKVTASATAASTGTYAYEVGSVSITDSTNGVDGTAATTTFYGHDTTYTAEKGVTLDTSTNKFKASLVDETADASAAGTGQLYAVKLDSNSKLAVNVPWTDQNVTQTEKTTAGYYPLLFANSGITPANDPPTSTADITNATITTETAGVNKNKHVFVNIDGTTGNATLYSDVFVGLTTTPAANTNDGQLASTAFVQNAIAAALSINIGNFFVGERGVYVAYDADKVRIGHSKTYTDQTTTAQTTAGIYKTTVDTYGHVSSATAAGVDDLTGLTASATNTNKVMATNASGQITYEDWSVLELNCVAD